MGYIEIVLIAIGLSMDTFAVSITMGLSLKKPTVKQYLSLGAYFGVFHILMPLTGYLTGTLFAERVMSFDHWIAFALLGFIGGKMVKESFDKDRDESEKRENMMRFVSMLLLSLATSIDALAVGVTFAFFKINLAAAVMIMGFTTFSISIVGVKIGSIFGTRFKSQAEAFGGLVLVALGVKILIEHLFMGSN